MELDELLAGSELLGVHLALTPETRGFLDAERIARSTAPAVHCSRAALTSGPDPRCRAAACTRHRSRRRDDRRDVETLSRPRRTFYPPIGYCTREAATARGERFLGDLRPRITSRRRGSSH
jgi:hypothetical protein